MTREQIVRRFKAKFDVHDSGCWVWRESKDRQGYGRMRVSPTSYVRVNRLAYELFWQVKVPPSLFVCHHCDNPSCVNPWHLFLGTPADNMNDKVAKGRQSKGEAHARAIKKVPVGAKNGRAKMSEQDAAEVLELLKAGVPGASIARQKGVTPTVICNIKKGRLWKHLPRCA